MPSLSVENYIKTIFQVCMSGDGQAATGQLASALGVSPGTVTSMLKALSESSLARLVVKETGLSFGRWRQQLHLIVAIRELASGASVQQVSGDLGYESVTAFITMFKKVLGKPPAKYLSSVVHRGGSAFVA